MVGRFVSGLTASVWGFSAGHHIPPPPDANYYEKKKAALNSLQLRLVATVVSEVLASPLPPVVLAMLKAARSSDGNPDGGGGRRSSAADDGGVAEGMEDDPVAPGSSHGRNWRGMGARAFMRPPPTVAKSWATQRQADWETLEVCVYVSGGM